MIPLAVSKMIKLTKVRGSNGKANDLIISRINTGPTRGLTVFFHGDIQDYADEMDKSGAYYEWNLENTGKLIANKFPDDYVVLIKAAKQKNYGFKKNLFDNFVETNYCGDGVYQMNVDSLLHLKLLIDQASSVVGFELKDIIHIKLVGFSQGVTALNQLVYSLHALRSIENNSLVNFASLIRHVYWLDGGRSWITDKRVLKVLEESNINCHIAVTPFQVNNPERVVNKKNFFIFKALIENMKIKSDCTRYFEDERPALENHFKLLKVFIP